MMVDTEFFTRVYPQSSFRVAGHRRRHPRGCFGVRSVAAERFSKFSLLSRRKPDMHRAFKCNLGQHQLVLVSDRDVLPVPIENAPATRPARPVSTTACGETPPPPTPAISAELVTSPSTAPNTVGRNQPPDTSRCRCDHPAEVAASVTAASRSGIGSGTCSLAMTNILPLAPTSSDAAMHKPRKQRRRRKADRSRYVRRGFLAPYGTSGGDSEGDTVTGSICPACGQLE